jgi:O-methyltransferase
MSVTLQDIGQRALSQTETLEATYDITCAILIRDTPGDFVECGVFAGAQVAAMAKACMDLNGMDRRIHLFDSFQGVPAPGPYDNDIRAAGGIWLSPPVSACSLDDVKANMQEWGIDPALLVYHCGLFEETIPRAEIDSIALLRLDGDLYASTRVCIEHLYPKVSRGGWCIVDDWILDGCRRAVNETLGHPSPVYWRKID